MNKTINFNKDLYEKIIEVKTLYKTKYHLDISLNWLINHLILEGINNAPLTFTKHLQ